MGSYVKVIEFFLDLQAQNRYNTGMLKLIKNSLFFPLAYYFAFFAKIRLVLWRPRVIVITGSSGKTSLLHLVEAGVLDKARYSHRANSAIGVPFDILGIKRQSLMFYEWPLLLLSPFAAIFKKPYKEKLYIVEADCDRPGEGKFLANLLKPEVVLWTTTTRTHSMNFDSLVAQGKVASVEEAIAYEFGYFMEIAKKLVIINGDSNLMKMQIPRTKAKILEISRKDLGSYEVSIKQTKFEVKGKTFVFKYLLPEEFFYSIAFALSLFEYLEVDKFDFKSFSLPAGRSSIFRGKKNTLLIDSTYNSNLSSMTAILNMFEKIDHNKKWAVVGDMLEQGVSEQEEHENLAQILLGMKVNKIILLGPRVEKYAYPILKNNLPGSVSLEKFLSPKDLYKYLKINISGGELILFKGVRFMEGVIENLLAFKSDRQYLARREKVWQIRRKKWGL